jgi:DNA-binding Xre family transcriptional regulator
MIDYTPLRVTLAEKNLKISCLETVKGGPLNSRTVSKLRNNKSVNLTTIESVCEFLDVPIEKIVEIRRNEK